MIRKIISFFNYLGVTILLLISFIGGTILYPFIYWFKDSTLSRKYPLWWWFDDEDGLYGAQYWRDAKGITKKNWWISCRWSAWRNPMWNALTKLIPRSGIEFALNKYGLLIHNGKEVDLMNSAVFHYVNDDGTWNGNVGNWLSKKYSYSGWAFVWFEKQNRTYFRFSFAKKLIGPLDFELQIGTFQRYLFKMKLKWHNKIFENKDIPLRNWEEIIVKYNSIALPKKNFFTTKVEKYIINN